MHVSSQYHLLYWIESNGYRHGRDYELHYQCIKENRLIVKLWISTRKKNIRNGFIIAKWKSQIEWQSNLPFGVFIIHLILFGNRIARKNFLFETIYMPMDEFESFHQMVGNNPINSAMLVL